MGRSRLFDIGDGNETNLVSGFRLIELAVDRGQCDLLRLEIVLCAEHIEVTLRDARHQVLFSRLVIRLGLGHLGVRAFKCLPVFPAKQALSQIDGVVVDCGLDFAAEGEALQHRRRVADLRARDADRRHAAGRKGHRLGGVLRSGVARAGDQAATREVRQQVGQSLRLGFQGG